ncbi:hypothetical protein HXX25_12275 [Hyphobacterium sp. CCMP332]|uniref:hypothetical protein n=1 Tax=Hyphobacterium sp. CCMP332 TaxID=2749086 RepID=UPI00164F61EB|nr:hypothetical protein [Hyphobacterium sp. CCMP332]QNL20035.1 hypothetical protein HXX25_12275 [Hyphobacterium sp. CCMP332]
MLAASVGPASQPMEFERRLSRRSLGEGGPTFQILMRHAPAGPSLLAKAAGARARLPNPGGFDAFGNLVLAASAPASGQATAPATEEEVREAYDAFLDWVAGW